MWWEGSEIFLEKAPTLFGTVSIEYQNRDNDNMEYSSQCSLAWPYLNQGAVGFPVLRHFAFHTG